MQRSQLALWLFALVASCGGASGGRVESRASGEVAMTWSEPARARIDELLTRFGPGGVERDPARAPIAVFDWDNTSMRGDVGDLALATMLDAELIRRPSSFLAWGGLTDGAVALLEASCPGEPGSALPTREDSPCRTAIAQVALGGALADGTLAFETPTTASYRASYGMMTRLFAGMTEAEAREIGRRAIERGRAAPLGARVRIGATEIDGFLRVQEPVHELMDELRERGFDVWIVSASFEPVVRVAASLAGVPDDHVIGARLELGEDGRYRPTHPYEAQLGPILTFDEGKRFWIRHGIFGVPVETAMTPPSAPGERVVLAAGDSDTDRAMLEDALGLAILFDRGAPRVTCLARAAPDRWLVVPQFVDPQPPRTVPCP